MLKHQTHPILLVYQFHKWLNLTIITQHSYEGVRNWTKLSFQKPLKQGFFECEVRVIILWYHKKVEYASFLYRIYAFPLRSTLKTSPGLQLAAPWPDATATYIPTYSFRGWSRCVFYLLYTSRRWQPRYSRAIAARQNYPQGYFTPMHQHMG